MASSRARAARAPGGGASVVEGALVGRSRVSAGVMACHPTGKQRFAASRRLRLQSHRTGAPRGRRPHGVRFRIDRNYSRFYHCGSQATYRSQNRMKAAHRKVLETNALADRMGRLLDNVKSGPKSASVVAWIFVILALVLFAAWQYYSRVSP